MTFITKMLSALLTLTLLSMSFNGAHAALVGNDVTIAQAQQQDARAELLQTIRRADVSEQLAAMGVSQASIESRVQLMTGDEVAQLNQQIGELPAGGDVLGVLLVIFIVFVITDVIGATDIFPFIKPVN